MFLFSEALLTVCQVVAPLQLTSMVNGWGSKLSSTGISLISDVIEGMLSKRQNCILQSGSPPARALRDAAQVCHSGFIDQLHIFYPLLGLRHRKKHGDTRFPKLKVAARVNLRFFLVREDIGNQWCSSF